MNWRICTRMLTSQPRQRIGDYCIRYNIMITTHIINMLYSGTPTQVDFSSKGYCCDDWVRSGHHDTHSSTWQRWSTTTQFYVFLPITLSGVPQQRLLSTVKRILSEPGTLPYIVQILVTFNLMLVEQVVILLYYIMVDNPKLSTLYTNDWGAGGHGVTQDCRSCVTSWRSTTRILPIYSTSTLRGWTPKTLDTGV